MYGDTSVIRALARRMRERAAEIRAEADELAGRAEAVPWTGLAADAMRRARRATMPPGCAPAPTPTSRPADALDRHAREVDHLKELIAAIEHRVRHLLRLRRRWRWPGFIGHVVPDAVDHWVHHFDPPPPAAASGSTYTCRGRRDRAPTCVVDVDLAVRRGRTTSAAARAARAARARSSRPSRRPASASRSSRLRRCRTGGPSSRAPAAVDVPAGRRAPAPADGPDLPWDLVVGTGRRWPATGPTCTTSWSPAPTRRSGEPVRRLHASRRPAAASRHRAGASPSAGSPGCCMADGWRALTPYVEREGGPSTDGPARAPATRGPRRTRSPAGRRGAR